MNTFRVGIVVVAAAVLLIGLTTILEDPVMIPSPTRTPTGGMWGFDQPPPTKDWPATYNRAGMFALTTVIVASTVLYVAHLYEKR